MPQALPDGLSALNCGTLHLDPERRIAEANSALVTWRGLRRDQIIGRDFGELLARGSVVYWETTVEPLLEQQGHAWDLAIELQTPGGDPLAVLVNARRTPDGTDCVMFPFTERRRYERKLLAAQVHARRQQAEIARLAELEAFRRDFINAAAHELATPMTPVQIQFHLLKQSLAGNADPKTQRALTAMQSNLDKLAKFTAALLASANVQAGQIGMRFTTIELDRALPKIVAAWREHHATKRDIQVDAAPVVLQADREALAGCIGHLLENAVKFSPPRGVVRVEVMPGPPVQIAVVDQGRGIDPARIPELGRPFAQVHDRAEFTALGAGLGLHIVSGLMQAHGGRLIVRSDGVGTGTRAILEFPAKTEGEVGTAARTESALSQGR